MGTEQKNTCHDKKPFATNIPLMQKLAIENTDIKIEIVNQLTSFYMKEHCFKMGK